MKLHVLVDNNTLIDRYLLAEPGLSFLIRDGETTVLFDAGYSDVFIRNAFKMGLDLCTLDYLVLSHSHLDHTWGLEPLIRFLTEREVERLPVRRPTLVAHPMVFTGVSDAEFKEAGCLVTKDRIAKQLELRLSAAPVRLSERLMFLGEIPRLSDFECTEAFGKKDGSDEGDTVIEDSALVYQGRNGLVVITGCCHAGICNTVRYAQELLGDQRIVDIIGGFHLQNPSERQLQGTIDFLTAAQPAAVHACHCTDLCSKIALAKHLNIKEVGVGLSLEFE
jgi:7,8-dihydropterin-6-yl-methyl-4-(beta-D-ribofuranosyl)aminobenzene 5'-phosphate synthase